MANNVSSTFFGPAPRLLAVVSALLHLICADAHAATQQRDITMTEATELVTKLHPEIEEAAQGVNGARALSKSQRGRMLPRIDVTDMQQWSYAEAAVGADAFPGLNPQGLVRAPKDITANILLLSATQPLLGLLHTGADLQASQAQLKAQQSHLAATQATLKAEVQSSLIKLFKSRAVARTAMASQQSLQEQLENARQEAHAGVLAHADVLRLQAALANASQQVIAAESITESLHAALVEMLGLADAPYPIHFVEPDMADVDVSGLPERAVLRSQALAHRPELHAYESLALAARKRCQAKTLALLPEISAQATFGHIFAQPLGIKDAHGGLSLNVFAVMLTGKWALWEWGASTYALKEASYSARAAAAKTESARRLVGQEIAARHAELLASTSAITEAKAQVDSAEEAFRVMQVTRAAGSATTTDLLQAEAARTQARMNLVGARYDAHLADVALKRALGASKSDAPQAKMMEHP